MPSVLPFWHHDDVIKWKHFSRYWPFVRGIHRSPVDFPHKDQWRGALMFSLICVWINVWVNNREASDLRRYRAHRDVIVMIVWVTDWLQTVEWAMYAPHVACVNIPAMHNSVWVKTNSNVSSPVVYNSNPTLPVFYTPLSLYTWTKTKNHCVIKTSNVTPHVKLTMPRSHTWGWNVH